MVSIRSSDVCRMKIPSRVVLPVYDQQTVMVRRYGCERQEVDHVARKDRRALRLSDPPQIAIRGAWRRSEDVPCVDALKATDELAAGEILIDQDPHMDADAARSAASAFSRSSASTKGR